MQIFKPDPGCAPATRNLLVAGLYAPGTGLTNVVSVIMRQLRGRFSVQGLGFQPGIDRNNIDIAVAGCPMRLQTASHVFLVNPDWLHRYMETAAPGGILVTGPAVMTNPLLIQLQRYRERCKLFLYLPVEGELVNEEITQTLALVDVCILYTECARNNVANLCRRVSLLDANFRAPRFYVAGHGVDTSDFFPLPGNPDGHFTCDGRTAAKRLLFPDKPELHNSFMVLNANRAYRRKRLDITISGFAAFALSHPNAYLYLHTGPTSKQTIAELRALIDASGVADRVLLNILNPDLSPLPIEKLNLLYNACDVGLTTAMGEGWGLVSFEHAATGTPQIVPSHTSFIENWTGAAELLDVVGREHIFYEYADMFTVLPQDVAGALKRLYSDTEYRREMAKAAYHRATKSHFKWSAVGRKFSDLLNEIMDETE